MFPTQLGFDGMFNSVKSKSMLSEKRLNSLYNVGLYCSNLDGDFAELGCHYGGTSFLLASLLKQGKRIHSFDSFEGMPEHRCDDEAHYLTGYLSANYDSVKQYLCSYSDKEVLYKGWVEDELIQVKDVKFSLVHIDLNLYAPTKFSINYMWNRIVDGGFIIFDDYRYPATPGVTRAVNEFFEDLFRYDHYFIEHQLGIMKR